MYRFFRNEHRRAFFYEDVKEITNRNILAFNLWKRRPTNTPFFCYNTLKYYLFENHKPNIIKKLEEYEKEEYLNNSIINISNDAWFGDTFAHQMARVLKEIGSFGANASDKFQQKR